MKKLDWYTRKIAYIYLKMSEWLVNFIVLVYAISYAKKNKVQEIKSIGAYWYYPPDLTGSNLRIGKWKSFFEKEGIKYDNLYINKFSEYQLNIENGSWTQKYLYFAKCLWRRLPQLLKAHHYDTIWIDRSLIPYYPRKTGFIEKQICKVVNKTVVDSTDGGDYQDNPRLMEDVFQAADKITVGYDYLKKLYEQRFDVTQIFWTIPVEGYLIKEHYKYNDYPVIGWMGSPGNFEHILGIVNVLKKVAKQRKFVFRYICRKRFSDELKDIPTDYHKYGDDYFDLLGSFDIGLCPFLTKDLRSKGKIAMKHQEFLLMGTPQVCSDVAISEFVEDGKEVLVATTEQEWENKLLQLIDNVELRKKLGENSKILFNKYYHYEGQFDALYNVLAK